MVSSPQKSCSFFVPPAVPSSSGSCDQRIDMSSEEPSPKYFSIISGNACTLIPTSRTSWRRSRLSRWCRTGRFATGIIGFGRKSVSGTEPRAQARGHHHRLHGKDSS